MIQSQEVRFRMEVSVGSFTVMIRVFISELRSVFGSHGSGFGSTRFDSIKPSQLSQRLGQHSVNSGQP
ncbi:hypothetical protein HanLR1_Chr09g0306161 [Helianthus annuus]|nr:hypothetical protein HanLR1_Chr09g0306161 [Helianthus annuus]